MCKKIILYRVITEKQGPIYYESYDDAIPMVQAQSQFTRDKIFSIDKVESKDDIRQAIIDVFLNHSNFWWKTELISYWENGEARGNVQRESPST